RRHPGAAGPRGRHRSRSRLPPVRGELADRDGADPPRSGETRLMSILVVGSVALDTLETPSGQVSEVLGGSATYFSLAASLYTPVRLVAVVAEVFPEVGRAVLAQRDVDLRGLEVRDGRTFRWGGRY